MKWEFKENHPFGEYNRLLNVPLFDRGSVCVCVCVCVCVSNRERESECRVCSYQY